MRSKLLIIFILWVFITCFGLEFTDLVVISGEGNFNLSSHARSNLKAASNGELFASYWSEDGTVSPESPSLVYVQKRLASGAWMEPVLVNEEFGARHSSLLLTDDSLHVTWHDYRHGASHSNWMNQVEIYYDRVNLDEFPHFQGNIRITSPDNVHIGNNRFVPVPVLVSSNEIGLVWYDFYFHGQRSEIFWHATNEGVWETVEEHSSLALTQGDSERNPFTMPDAAVHGDNVYLAWTDTTGWTGNLYYGIKQGESFQYEKVADNTSNYFDPPKMYLIYGTPYILATAYNEFNESVVILMEMDSDTPAAASARELGSFNGRQRRPVLYQEEGKFFLARIDNARNVVVAELEYPGWNVINEYNLFSGSLSDQEMKVALTGDSYGNLHVMWNYRGDVYFVSTESPTWAEIYSLFY